MHNHIKEVGYRSYVDTRTERVLVETKEETVYVANCVINGETCDDLVDIYFDTDAGPMSVPDPDVGDHGQEAFDGWLRDAGLTLDEFETLTANLTWRS